MDSMSFFVPTRFVWRFGGRQVHLCGSFTRWVETIPMAPVDSTPGVFAVVVHLPPGYHQYKFIVDGQWMHDETAPYMPDPLGNVNNWLFVKRIDPTPHQQQPPALGYEQAHQQLAQHQQQHQQHQQQQQQQQQPALALAPQLAPAHIVHHAAPAGPPPPLHVHPSQPLPMPVALPAVAAAAAPAAQPPPVPPAIIPTTGPLPSSGGGDVDMAAADSVVAPILIHGDAEPALSRHKVAEFLNSHTAYELIPESGKVVLLDADLPVRQAFHALHEQGAASAPIWDAREGTIAGVLSASDFIHVLRRLRSAVSSGSNALSEAEMDAHTIRGMREAGAVEGRQPKGLVYVKPQDTLHSVVRTLYLRRCSMAPILSTDTGGLEVPEVLHIATLSGVLACLMRHFRASLASLPLLSQPLGALALGTWEPGTALGGGDGGGMAMANGGASSARGGRQVQRLHTVKTTTPLTTALGMLLDTGVSALPVVDDSGALVDVYARADITLLCKGNAYNRLQWEDVTVGQALSLAHPGPSAWAQHSSHPGLAGITAELAAQQAGLLAVEGQVRGGAHTGGPGHRLCCVSRDESLRTCVERLAMPGVRRLVVVGRDTRHVEGIVSLSDMAGFLFGCGP